MKTRLFLLLWLLISSLSLASAQEYYPNLTIKPANPQPGKTITFTYDPKGTDLAGKIVEAIAYVYTHQRVKAYDVPLTQAKGLWKGTVPTTSASTGYHLYFKAGEEYDNNKGKGYGFLLHDEKKNPVKGAFGSLANATNGAISMMHMEKDMQKAAANLEKEFSLYPESKRDFMDIYASVLTAEKEEQAEALILKELDAMTQLPDLTAEQLTNISYLYRRYKQEEKAKQMAEKVKEMEPNGMLVQQEKLYEIHLEKELPKKRALADAFAAEFPENNNVVWALGMVLNEMAKQEQYDQFRAYLTKHPQAATWSAYNEAAWSMAEAGKNLDVAHEFAAKGYELAKIEVETPNGKKSDWITEKEWRENRLRNVGMVGDTYGYILMQQGKYAEALPLMEEAVRLQKEHDIAMNERYVDALMKNDKTAQAKLALEHYISTGKSNAGMKELLREVYVKEKGSEAGFNDYVKTVEAPALEKMRAMIKKKLISEPAPAFVLEDLNGKKVALSDLKGKTVIVDFWATWCGPCIKSFPGMQQAVNKYKDDEGVAFVFINAWENGEDKRKVAGDFMTKRNFTFDVLLDTENKTIGDFKVEGIPTKFVIDKAGNIRYKSVGFGGNDEATVTELSMLIDMLR